MNQSSQAPVSPKPTPEVILLANGVSGQTLLVGSFALALALLCAFLFSRRSSRSRGNTLLLVGPPDSGKTAILSNLAYNEALPSHTSLQSNATVVALPSGSNLRVVDIPGHPRIRDQFKDFMPDAKAIAFVVDASTISRNGAAVAEHLHHILHAITSLPPSQTAPALMILAHKADLLKTGTSSSSPGDVAVTRVRTILERELEKRRESGVGVEGLGEEGERSDMGGLDHNGPAGAPFKFAAWEGGELDFTATWIRIKNGDDEKHTDADGLEGMKDWLDQLPK
ncbi:signal recognition particle receptor beta subunit-domain-containing protein [Hygrophoropsis aurantiaca]|uniref:Signal recognition particle receptor beta subunit-domain-containing protein n=1 Tax=Hygrophoropsis aurantiaca TaxID=72124 RepID=A0ACB8AFS9_9AGAM|nr:signal recognition particle receptor beta subunit-domain-containing protein [Hygrophoropsis aurantiaca]